MKYKRNYDFNNFDRLSVWHCLVYNYLTIKLQNAYKSLKIQKYLPCIIQLQNKLRVIPKEIFIVSMLFFTCQGKNLNKF
jgi:hypothetical protein